MTRALRPIPPLAMFARQIAILRELGASPQTIAIAEQAMRMAEAELEAGTMSDEKPDELSEAMRAEVEATLRQLLLAAMDPPAGTVGPVWRLMLVTLVQKAIAEKDTQLEALTQDHERLTNLLKTTRDMNVVAVTADRDSWMEQARMAQDQAADLAQEVERLKAERDLAESNERAARELLTLKLREATDAGLRRAVEILKQCEALATWEYRSALGTARAAIEREIAGPKCPACGGEGKRLYNSTATWRGGHGGQSMTTDICDRCWGSGDERIPGPDLRAQGGR